MYNNILINIENEGQALMNDSNPIISRYSEVRDIILGHNDFVKKQNLILSFKDKFCREPLKEENEDVNWYYCIEVIQNYYQNFYLN